MFKDFCENVSEEAVPQLAFYEEVSDRAQFYTLSLSLCLSLIFTVYTLVIFDVFSPQQFKMCNKKAVQSLGELRDACRIFQQHRACGFPDLLVCCSVRARTVLSKVLILHYVGQERYYPRY